MTELLIHGGRPLQGETVIQGAKNSILPLLAATILTGDTVVLENCPHLREDRKSVV